ncbi:MAG: bifunctional 4-alpha-glucanotransferase/amylo-alpha-1,6-glucosidase, partial [Marteilia pararefringens]
FIGILEELFIDNYLKLPKFLKPKYFATIINFLCLLFEERCVLKNKHEMLPDFIKRLSVVSLQFYSSSNDEKFYRRDLTDGKGSLQHDCTLAAGMPHFASGLFRVWGRDTFISLRGLLLSFKRFEEAKQIILLFGRSMKGGLIPNLLGDGYEHAKYNSRDAVWWWLKSICDFCEIQGNESILEEKIILNHDPARKLITLGSLIHECLEQHSSAAPNNSLESIFVDESTGFVKGGTWHDSGTWMDKCDDSEERKPSTPRDGAAIELQALLYSVLCWFSRSSFARNNSEFLTVKWKKSQSMELSKWAEILKMNFVKNFLFVSSNRNGNKRSYYSMADNYSDPGVHRGKSYHNGPEWVWVKLYHLTAMIKIFSTDKSGQEFVFKRCKQELMKYESRLNQNYYGSLEELTNNSGGHCADSCQSQAWSIAALVEFDMMFNSFIKSLGTE